MRAGTATLLTAVILAGLGAGPSGAEEPFPDPGYPVVPCASATQRIVLVANAQLDPDCTYSGGVDITASDVTLDCRGAFVASAGTSGVGIRIQTPADEDMSGVTVRNCLISGFGNGIRVTREGFRGLPADHEYDHALEDVTLTGNQVSGTRGVGIFVDGYVTATTISDSLITGTGSSGVYLEAGSADNVVTGNQILDNGFIENGPGGQLESFGGSRFRFWGTGREGISVDGSRRNLIAGNTIEGNSAGGIYIYTNCGEYVNSKPERYFPRRYGATDNEIVGNRIADGVSGVWVGARMGENMLPMECSDEPYYEDGGKVITLDRAADNTVRDNAFENLTYGVRVEDDRTTVSGNEFSGPDHGQYAVIVGTPYRTVALDRPVTGTVLTGNRSTITGNESPYRWVDGQAGTTVNGNEALGRSVGICEGKALPRGIFVMTIAVAHEPPGAPVTPTPADLAIPPVGPQEACPRESSPPPPGPPGPPDPPGPPGPPSNEFRFGALKLNRKAGTATLKVIVPGAGTATLKGSREVRKAAKRSAKAATLSLQVRPKGKKAARLRRAGTVILKATVSFAPDGGDPRSKSRNVRLHRKR